MTTATVTGNSADDRPACTVERRGPQRGWLDSTLSRSRRPAQQSQHPSPGWPLAAQMPCRLRLQEIVDALRIDAADLFDGEEGRRGGLIPYDDRATAQPTAGRLPEDLALVPSGQSGLTLDRYAPFVTATIRAKDGEASQWWRVTAFSDTAQAELMRLGDGDSCCVQGAFKAELFQPEAEEARVSLSIVADHVWRAIAARSRSFISEPTRSRTDQICHTSADKPRLAGTDRIFAQTPRWSPIQ
jgi:hypothetical protein